MDKPVPKRPMLPLLVCAAAVLAAFALYAWRSRAGLNSALAIAAVAGCAAACLLLLWRAYVLLFQKRAPLFRVFVPAALLLGLLFGLAFPVGAVPDEFQHADAVYLCANRILGVEDAPAEEQFSNVYRTVDTGMRREDATERALLTAEPSLAAYRAVLAEADFWLDAEQSAPVPAELVDLGVSPVLYAPAVAAVLLGRTVHLGYYPLLLFARLCMLLCYVGMTAWAIRLTPVGKAGLFVTALLPMALSLACSLSYDAVILALAFPLLASLLDMAYGRHARLTRGQLIRTAALTALLACCKVGAYLPLLLLVFLIPRDRFARKGRRALLFFGLAGVGLAACVLGNLRAVTAALSGGFVSALPGNEAGKYTFSFLLREPVSALRMMARTVLTGFKSWVATCLGQRLGWLNVPVSGMVIGGFGLLLAGSCLHPQDEPLPAVRGGQRLLFLAPPVLTLLAFLVGMLLWWTPVGSDVILGVQGRYFLPVVPCLLLALPRVTYAGTLHWTERTAVAVGKSPDRVIAFLAVLLSALALAGLYPMLMAR